MKNILIGVFCSLVIMLSGASVFAQDEFNKVEFYGGFSHNRIDTSLGEEDDDFDSVIDDRQGANGVNMSITGNVHKYVGLKFDFATHRKTLNETFGGDPFQFKYRTNNFLGGIQIKNNKKDGPRVKPFAHFLAGVANQKISLTGDFTTIEGTTPGSRTESISQNNFAMAIGGGIDVKVHKNVDIRVIQFDFNPTYLKDTDDFEIGGVQKNYRFGFGIVIH